MLFNMDKLKSGINNLVHSTRYMTGTAVELATLH